MSNKYTDNNLPVYLAISCFLHCIIFYLIFFGLSFSPKLLSEEKIISFELLPAAPVNNVKTQKIQKEETVKNEDAKLVEKNKAPEVFEEKKEEIFLEKRS